MRTLHYGDNLDILRRDVADQSVDLVYLAPPFNSAQTYKAFFQERDGTIAATDETFKRAPKAKARGHRQHEIGI